MHATPTTRINILFADAVHTAYKKKRYGIKRCNLVYDPEYLSDLRTLQKRAMEIKACGIERNSVCSLTKLNEIIKTL